MPTQKQFLDLTGLTKLLEELGLALKNNNKIYLGTCSTTANTYQKVATVETFPTIEYDDNGTTKIKPVTGIVVGIKYSVSNTYKTEGYTYTLTVNSTGEWPMYYNNAALATSTSANTLVAGYKNRYCYYVFNGTQWVWLSAGSDTNTTYSAMTQAEITDGTGTTGRTMTPARLRANFYTEGEVDTLLNSKQATLTFDSAPTADSTNPVTSGGVKTALDGKQDLLVSGTNIKTINNNSLVGSGNVTIDSDSITMADADPNDGIWGSGDTIQEAMEGITDGILTVYNEAKPKDFVVTLSKNNSIYTADKTYALILTAYNNGKNVVVKYGTDVLNVSEKYSNSIRFSTSSAEEGVLRGFEVKSNDTWELFQFEAQDHLTFDSTPTANSYNPVTSGGIKEALDGKLDHIELSPLYEYLEGQGAVSEATAVVWNAEMQTLWNKATTQSGKMRTFQGYPAFPEDTGDNTYAWDIYGIFGAAVYIVAKVGYLIDNNGITKYYIASQEWKILQEHLTFDSTPTSNSNNPVKSSGIKTALDGKQNTLVSGTNIKTVNNTSLLGSGNIDTSELYIVPSQSTGALLYAAAGYVLDQSQINTICEEILTALKNDKKLYFEFDNSGEGSANETYVATYADYVEQENRSTVVNFIVNYNILAFYKVTLTKAYGATNWVVTYINKSAQEQLVSGTNIKTIHNNSLLGSGNIELTASNIEVQNGDTVQDSIDSLTNAKQDRLVSGTNIKTVNNNSLLGSGDVHFDGSNLVYSGDEIQELVAGETIDENLDRLDVLVHGKQDTLVSGTNIKTVNNNSLLGEGNVQVGDITGEELETEIEELESTLLTDALRKSEQVLSQPEKTQVLTNLGIADVAKESNLKTINGASIVGSGDILVVSVDAGDINVLQTTGESLVDVMSQKAVSDYTRKVTAEDLAGTSDWIKAKLTEEGWEFEKYVNSSGTLSVRASYCASAFIPVSNIKEHSLTVCYMYSTYSTSYFCFYDSNKNYITGLRYSMNSDNSRTISIDTSATWDDVAYIRITCNPNKLSECYIKDNTANEYVWRGNEYIESFCDNFLINSGVFRNTFVSQEEGTSKTKVMSQDALSGLGFANRFTNNIIPCKGITTTNQTYRTIGLKLNDKQKQLLENADVITIRISSKKFWENNNYAGVQGAFWFLYNSAGGFTGITSCGIQNALATIRTSSFIRYYPDHLTFVIDVINGIVKLYWEKELLNTFTDEGYKKENILNEYVILKIFNGNTQIPFVLYQFDIYDGDITPVFDITQMKDYLSFDSIPPIIKQNYFQTTHDGSMAPSTYGSATGYTVVQASSSADGYKHITSSSSTTWFPVGYYISHADTGRLTKYCAHIEVVSGAIAVNVRSSGCNSTIPIVVNKQTGETVDASNVGIGEYKVIGWGYGVDTWAIKYVSGDPMEVIIKETDWHLISCVVSLDCRHLYNGQLYDKEVGMFYPKAATLNEPLSLGRVFVDPTPSYEEFNPIETSVSKRPGHTGQMAITNNNVYVSVNKDVWKQINNS